MFISRHKQVNLLEEKEAQYPLTFSCMIITGLFSQIYVEQKIMPGPIK